jgi:arsenate reductase
MAEGLLRLLGKSEYEVLSAGTKPASEVHPVALSALRERGIDTSGFRAKKVFELVDEPFDMVITVCDQAAKECPHFPKAGKIEHWSIEDPVEFKGDYYEILEKFREIRGVIEDKIKERILET